MWLASFVATWWVGFAAGRWAHSLEAWHQLGRFFTIFVFSAGAGFGMAATLRWLRPAVSYNESPAASRGQLYDPALSTLGAPSFEDDRRWENLAQATHALLGILCQTLPKSRAALVRLEGSGRHLTVRPLVCRPAHWRPEIETAALARAVAQASLVPCQPVACDASQTGPRALAVAVWPEARPQLAPSSEPAPPTHWVHLLIERPEGPAFSDTERHLAQSLVEQLALSHQLEVALKTSQADLGRLAHLATTDGLTELANRRHFMGVLDLQLARARRHARPLSLLFLDIDHFKAVNDTFGHAVGDEILRGLAQLLTDTARCTDLVARYGGEEFAILMDETNLSGAGRMAERICQALRHTRLGKEVALEKTCSIGVASFPEHGQEARALIEAADSALYEAKRRGRNQIVLFGHDAGAPRHGERSMG